jgi:putative transposase
MRKPRVQLADTAYHVSTRGNRRQEIVRDMQDGLRFLAILREIVLRRSWTCLCYCLMTNHYHLIVQTPAPDLACGMRELNHLVARTFNRRHGYEGHLFERRYWSEIIETDTYLLNTVRYIALNPVRAGLTATPEGWPWSSYAASIGFRPVDDFANLDGLLNMLAPTRERAQQALRDFVFSGAVGSRAA